MKHRTGVYQIRNQINGKLYIGSAAVDILDRWSIHRSYLNSKKHHSIKLQRAWNKYGAENFVFEVLLHCDPENCLAYEQVALDYFKPEYNVCKKAGSQLGYRHTEQAKAKMRGSRGKSFSRMRKLIQTGKIPSKLTRQKMSRSNSGEGNGFAKLSHTDIIEIRKLSAGGLSGRKIAKIFGVHSSTVHLILSGKTWKTCPP